MGHLGWNGSGAQVWPLSIHVVYVLHGPVPCLTVELRIRKPVDGTAHYGKTGQVEQYLDSWRPGASLEAPATHQSSRDLRESENLHAIGGLRNPRHAVRKSPQPREVGSRIRQVLDSMSWRFSALSFKKRTSLQDWRTDGFQSFVRNLQTHSRLLRFSPASKRPCGPQCSAMLPILTQKS